jgi:hypothetical protein
MERIAQRDLRVEELLAALEGRAMRQQDRTIFYDRGSRCVVVVKGDVVLTAYRTRRGEVKRTFGRGRI